MDIYNNTNGDSPATSRAVIPVSLDASLIPPQPNESLHYSNVTSPSIILQRPPLFRESLNIAMIIFFCVAYFAVFILALVNNSLVLTVIYKNTQMHTVTNYFLANLAAADITVSFIVLPITLLSIILSGKYMIDFILDYLSIKFKSM